MKIEPRANIFLKRLQAMPYWYLISHQICVYQFQFTLKATSRVCVVFNISKIQLVFYYQCCDLIGWATTRLYVIAYYPCEMNFQSSGNSNLFQDMQMSKDKKP